jgi:hypothetical protein
VSALALVSASVLASESVLEWALEWALASESEWVLVSE